MPTNPKKVPRGAPLLSPQSPSACLIQKPRIASLRAFRTAPSLNILLERLLILRGPDPRRYRLIERPTETMIHITLQMVSVRALDRVILPFLLPANHQVQRVSHCATCLVGQQSHFRWRLSVFQQASSTPLTVCLTVLFRSLPFSIPVTRTPESSPRFLRYTSSHMPLLG